MQSRAHPREIMTEVLKALRELNVCWKKIGHYNMKCMWNPGVSSHEVVSNPVQSNYFGDESTIIENDGATKSKNVVKFEVQVKSTKQRESFYPFQSNLSGLIAVPIPFYN